MTQFPGAVEASLSCIGRRQKVSATLYSYYVAYHDFRTTRLALPYLL